MRNSLGSKLSETSLFLGNIFFCVLVHIIPSQFSFNVEYISDFSKQSYGKTIKISKQIRNSILLRFSSFTVLCVICMFLFACKNCDTLDNSIKLFFLLKSKILTRLNKKYVFRLALFQLFLNGNLLFYELIQTA